MFKKNKPKRYLQLNQVQSELFWKFPKFLLENKKYASLTNDDRVAYIIIRDRFRYSQANNWLDEKGVYVYFTIEDLKTQLHVGKNKVTRIKKHLDDLDLLDIEHSDFDPLLGQTPPDRFYLLTPEYEPENLASSRVPKVNTRNSTTDFEENPDASTNSITDQQVNISKSLDNSGIPKMGNDKDNTNKDTIKDTITDTQLEEWNFDPNNYSQEIVRQQNKDLLHNLANTLTDDSSLPMFLSKESINLITLWFRTPEAVSDCISVILSAANSSRRDAIKQIGEHELYFEGHQGELKRKISFKLRRFINKMRTSRKGTIKNPRNYLFIAMKNLFNKWQNDILMAEHKANANVSA